MIQTVALACLAASTQAAPEMKTNFLRSGLNTTGRHFNTSARQLSMATPQIISAATAQAWQSYCDLAGITLCDGYDYTGTCFTGLDIVNHPTIADNLHNTKSELGTRDFNDHIRSVRVPNGCVLHLFDEKNHRGWRNDIIQDKNLCAGWDTGVSSLWLSGFDYTQFLLDSTGHSFRYPGQYLGSENRCVGQFLPTTLSPRHGLSAFNLNYKSAKWLEDNNMLREVERAEYGKIPGHRCDHDGDCLNLRCVYSICRHGYPGDPCEHDSDCVPDFKDSWKQEPGVCVQNKCRNGYIGDFCEQDGDCQGNLKCRGDNSPSIAQGVAGGTGILSAAGGSVAVLAASPVGAAALAVVGAGAAVAEAAVLIWGLFHVEQCVQP